MKGSRKKEVYKFKETSEQEKIVNFRLPKNFYLRLVHLYSFICGKSKPILV